MEPLLDSKGIQKYLGISYSRFLKYTREDPTFPVRKIGGEWKSDPSELRSWFCNQPTPLELIESRQQAPKRKGRPLSSARIQKPANEWTINIPL